MSDLSNSRIIRVGDDESDEFFVSKHVNKRREEYESMKLETFSKLVNGLKNVIIDYKHEIWKDGKEKLFLELFSKLHVNNKFHQNIYNCGYYLSDKRKSICFYDLKSNTFWIDYDSIWKLFYEQFDMNYNDIQSLMRNILTERFKLRVTMTRHCFLQVKFV